MLANGLTFGQDMESYLWKNRVVLIFGDKSYGYQEKKQLRAFTSFTKEIEERDMIILAPKKNERRALLEKFRLNDSFSGLILVGKDGGIKLNQSLVVEPKTVFDLIDSMPMRKSEMRKKQNRPH